MYFAHQHRAPEQELRFSGIFQIRRVRGAYTMEETVATCGVFRSRFLASIEGGWAGSVQWYCSVIKQHVWWVKAAHASTRLNVDSEDPDITVGHSTG
jgi:hypothetical protein